MPRPDKIDISQYDYPLPDSRIARFPPARRGDSRLLVWRDGSISEGAFSDIGRHLPVGSLLVFNDTRVIRARLAMHKPTGARVEIFCLEPHCPADYEHAFGARGRCEWRCMVGNLRRWKSGSVSADFCIEGQKHTLRASLVAADGEPTVRFEWDGDATFGQLLEELGHIPIPPYLGRESDESDTVRYQTVYSRRDGSVAAPTAGLHFTPELIGELEAAGVATERVTLHVGAGTFLPVKGDDAAAHAMHTEHFEVSAAAIRNLMEHSGRVAAVGTTSVRTLESLPVLGRRVMCGGSPDTGRAVGQWEAWDIPEQHTGVELLAALAGWMEERGIDTLRASTQIMITPGFRFRVVDTMITNFHQPRSTLLLLVSAFVGGDGWRRIYDHALAAGFRFLSYGDSSILTR